MEENQNYLSSLKKGVKDYLLEFFLLFTAVTLGFFAENLREEFVQARLEIRLMKSMVADLERNQGLLHQQQDALMRRKVAADSLSYFFNQPDVEAHGAKLYQYGRQLAVYASEFPLASRSLDQLKNSGLFSIISKERVADSLSNYDNFKTRYEQRIKWYFEDVKKVQDENKHIFDAHVFEKATRYTDLEGNWIFLVPEGNPELATDQEKELVLYYNTVYYLKRNTEIQIREVKQLLQRTIELKNLLVEAYEF
ncbi:MAG: hypothetical protein NBV57_01250 [Algoriphagus sp.]|nr:hypothetical protein [Algoriphagus sp.]